MQKGDKGQSSSDRKQLYQAKKEELQRQQQKAEDELLAKQLQEAEQDIREYRRDLLLQRHVLEKSLLLEVSIFPKGEVRERERDLGL